MRPDDYLLVLWPTIHPAYGDNDAFSFYLVLDRFILINEIINELGFCTVQPQDWLGEGTRSIYSTGFSPRKQTLFLLKLICDDMTLMILEE